MATECWCAMRFACLHRCYCNWCCGRRFRDVISVHDNMMLVCNPPACNIGIILHLLSCVYLPKRHPSYLVYLPCCKCSVLKLVDKIMHLEMKRKRINLKIRYWVLQGSGKSTPTFASPCDKVTYYVYIYMTLPSNVYSANQATSYWPFFVWQKEV